MVSALATTTSMFSQERRPRVHVIVLTGNSLHKFQ